MRTFIESYRKTLVLLGSEWRRRWIMLVVLAAIVMAIEAVGAVLVFAMMGLISDPNAELSLPLVGNVSGLLPAMERESLMLVVAGFVAGFFLLRAAAVVGQTYVQARTVHNAGARLAAHLAHGYLALPYLFHTRQNSAQLVRNTFDSVQTFVRQVLRPLVLVVAQSTLALGLAVVMLAAAPGATLLALAVLGPLVWLLMHGVQPRLKRIGRDAQDTKEGSLKALQQSLGGVRDIKLLGRERHFGRAFARQREGLARAEYVHNTLNELPRALIETGLVLVIVALFTVAVVRGDDLESVLSTLGLFAYAGFRLQPALRTIVKGLNDVRYGAAVLDDLVTDRQRVDAALAETAERARPDDGQPSFTTALTFDGVSFRYADDGAWALRDVDLSVRQGETLGICGPTGGGKSTLVDLMVGLLEPSEGEIRVDGRPLSGRSAWWHEQLGVVSQNVFLIDDTLRANIAFGIPEDQVDGDRLRRAISRAQLDDVVASMPEGLDTAVGERGIRLSGGQRQRVAVARALYLEPPVIVFDEGTSALDSATETTLMSAIDALRAERTLILVAHRLSTVRHADRIVVVEAGRIAAQGNYDELIDANELFRALAT